MVIILKGVGDDCGNYTKNSSKSSYNNRNCVYFIHVFHRVKGKLIIYKRYTSFKKKDRLLITIGIDVNDPALNNIADIPKTIGNDI